MGNWKDGCAHRIWGSQELSSRCKRSVFLGGSPPFCPELQIFSLIGLYLILGPKVGTFPPISNTENPPPLTCSQGAGQEVLPSCPAQHGGGWSFLWETLPGRTSGSQPMWREAAEVLMRRLPCLPGGEPLVRRRRRAPLCPSAGCHIWTGAR